MRVAAGCAALPVLAGTAPLDLNQAPAGSARAPAPNVIISVADAGRMDGKAADALRDALERAMADTSVPDGSIRLGWQDLHRCNGLPARRGACAGQNGVRVLDARQRARFRAWAADLQPQGAAPPYRLLTNAGDYLRRTDLGADSPWAAVPGRVEGPLLACRKAYNIFISAGGQRAAVPPDSATAGIGNADGTPRTLPDGTRYDPSSADALPFGDDDGALGRPTLPDLAFHYWATDLQPGLADAVPARPRASSQAQAETVAFGARMRTLQPYWNPRHDPATWQHLVTYTLGFDDAAQADAAAPALGSDTWTGDDYAALVTGAARWPRDADGEAARPMAQLWHMALNARGRFAAAGGPGNLAAALANMLDAILADQSAPPASHIASLVTSSRSTRAPATAFLARYDGADWTGDIQAFGIAAGSADLSGAGPWGTVAGSAPPSPVSTATLLDAANFSPQARVVRSAAGGVGIDWRWPNLSADQRAALDSLDGHADGLGEQRLAFLRGERTDEASHGGRFRTRRSRQGDIVHSRPWFHDGPPGAAYGTAGYRDFRRDFAERPAMLYVGGNDGMLHAFAAASGQEKLAYVPEGLHPHLSELTRPGYRHRYFVDGSPLAGDLQVDGSWRTYLAAFLGAGGRGYVVLDVTDPAQLAPARLVVMDKTAAPALDGDVGHIVAEPVMDPAHPQTTQQITQLNDGRWALVMGNGYNSPNARAVLLIQYLDGARELRKLVAGAGATPTDARASATAAVAGNGLGAPRLVDLDGDRIPDVAYAGDLAGQLWKFDLGSSDPTDVDRPWRLALGGAPLFAAKDASGKAQPITAAPVALPHPEGGLMLVFGTGRQLTDADRADTSAQSIYGVYDNMQADRAPDAPRATDGTPITSGRAALVAQHIGVTPAGTADASGARLWTFSSNAVAYSGAAARRGWYVDLPEPGERVLAHAGRFDGTLVDVTSVVPGSLPGGATESCAARPQAERRFLNTLNGLTGAAPRSSLYAYTPGSSQAPAALVASRIESGLRSRMPSDAQDKGVCPPGAACEDRARLGRSALRPSWRLLH